MAVIVNLRPRGYRTRPEVLKVETRLAKGRPIEPAPSALVQWHARAAFAAAG
jgi:hypothetical protein